ncbi:MAG: hypothetical protein M1824_006348 [Vezdaea acicularis]|nr:MAG: hypothetical protein M1824_006348 [Vezdaea acicularis]
MPRKVRKSTELSIRSPKTKKELPIEVPSPSAGRRGRSGAVKPDDIPKTEEELSAEVPSPSLVRRGRSGAVKPSDTPKAEEEPSAEVLSPSAGKRGRKRAAEQDDTPKKRARRSENGVNSEVLKAEAIKIEQVKEISPPPLKRGRKAKANGTKPQPIEDEANDTANPTPTGTPKKSRKKAPKAPLETDAANTDDSNAPAKPKRKRKTAEEKALEAMPLAARTPLLKQYIGAHVSSAKGVHNSITNSVHIGGNAFALFLKSQRKWENPPLNTEHAALFKAACVEHKYDAGKHVIPHGSYLVNLAQAEEAKKEQAYNTFVDDLKRCDSLGIKLYNFHPGNTGGAPRAEAISRIAAALNRAHAETESVVTVLENMAGTNNVIGAQFEDLGAIIAEVQDKSRVGVCLDTCHTFAAGHALDPPKAFHETMDKFDKLVGMQYLRALHLNDSKAPFASHRDLHQNIGVGFLGLRAFHTIMNDSRFWGLPMVLETPIDRKDADGKDIEDKRVWAQEIKLLESLVGMDVQSKEFRRLEKELAERGMEERKKYQDQFERKLEKLSKAATKGMVNGMAAWIGKGKGKEGRKVETSDEEE